MAIHGPWFGQAFDDYLSTKTVKAMLLTPAYVDDINAAHRSDLANEVTGAGYTAGGVPAAGVNARWDAAGQIATITCDPVDFGVLTLDTPLGGIAFYIDGGSAPADSIIAVDVFEAERQVEVQGVPFKYSPDTTYGFVTATIGA